MFETLAIRLYFIIVSEKALVLVVYPLPTLRFELRSVDRLSLAHRGVDE